MSLLSENNLDGHTSFHDKPSVNGCSFRRAKKLVSAFCAAARFSGGKNNSGVNQMHKIEHTLSQIFQELPKSFLPFSIVSSPPVEATIFLPSSPKIGPACSRTFNLVFQKSIILVFRIRCLLVLFDRRLAQFSSTFLAVFIKSFTSRRHGG